MILVTGGLGYIGENFIRKHPDESFSYDIKLGQDVLDENLLESYMLMADTVVHLSAISGIGACEKGVPEAVLNNIMGTLTVCRLASKHGVKIVYASSQAVHRDSVYGLSKKIGERVVSYYDGVSLRFSNVWGGGNYLGMKDSAIARLNKGTWEDRGDNAEVRDFIHVDNVCNRIYESIYPSGVYDVCSGVKITIGELQEKFKLGEYRL